MSIEIIYYPTRATKADLKRHLISLGFRPTGHLWEWPKGSVHYHWFQQRDYVSFDGVETTIFPVDAEDSHIPTPLGWALHTRVRSSGSSFDRAQQNNVIRTARRQFGGTFINDWYGRNRYTKIEKDPRGPAERGLFLVYERVNEDVEAVIAALPKPLIGELSDPLAAFAQADPARCSTML
jgi:hypothetical protein